MTGSRSIEGEMSEALVLVRLAPSGPVVTATAITAVEEGYDRAAGLRGLLSVAPRPLDEPLDTVTVPAAETFIARLSSLVFASAETGAQVKIALKWSPGTA